MRDGGGRIRSVDWQHWLPWLIYGMLFPFIAFLAIKDSIDLHYSWLFVALSFVCYFLNWVAIFLYAFPLRSAVIEKAAKIIFPLLIFELITGVLMDAFMPLDYNIRTDGIRWLMNASFGLLCVSPAYYASFRVAYRSSH